jgi:hypothetical protein
MCCLLEFYCLAEVHDSPQVVATIATLSQGPKCTELGRFPAAAERAKPSVMRDFHMSSAHRLCELKASSRRCAQCRWSGQPRDVAKSSWILPQCFYPMKHQMSDRVKSTPWITTINLPGNGLHDQC